MNKRLLTLTSYLGYFLIGFISIILAPSLPLMIRDFHLSLGAAGAAFSARAAGSFFGALLGGVLSDKLGRKPLIIYGCLFQGIATAVIAATNNWYWVLMLFTITGLAGGFLNTSINALVAEVNAHRRGAAMNTLHGIYGIGSLIGPVVVGLVLTLEFGWRSVFYGAAVLWFLFMFIVIPLTYPPAAASSSKKQENIPVRTFVFHPIFMILFTISFIYNGVATGLVGWINTYMGDMQFSILLGASMITIFYIGLTGGRFVCRVFADRIGFSRTILICAIGSLFFYPLAVFTAQPFIIAVGVFFSGFFFSGLHPTGLAYANKLFPSAAGTISGTLSTAMALGAMAIPWLIGFIADYRGFKLGLGLGFFLVIFLAAAAFFLLYMEKRDKKTDVQM